MIVDLDDFSPKNHRADLLYRLKEINPDFRVTLFAIPAEGQLYMPRDWVEQVPHGFWHGDPATDGGECRDWPYERAVSFIEDIEAAQTIDVWERGFKAPGWQISDGCYQAFLEAGWWVADQHLEDHRRPGGLRTYFYEDGPDRWHGHIQNVCGNGLAERFDELAERVRHADRFQFASEAAKPW